MPPTGEVNSPLQFKLTHHPRTPGVLNRFSACYIQVFVAIF